MFSRTAFRLSALSASIFALIGVYMPFFPVWLEQRGLDGSTIGVILAVPIIVRIVVTAPLVALTEKGVDARVLLCVAQVCLAGIYLTLLSVSGALAIAVVVACAAVAQAALVPTADLVTTDAVREDPRLSYSSIRLWGSISFLVCSIGAGYVLQVATVDALVVALSVLALLSAAVALGVPINPAARAAAVRERSRARLPPPLIWMIAGAALIQSSHAALYGFGSILWRGQGFADPTIGFLWAIGVMAEILLFWLVGRGLGRGFGRRLDGVRLMLLGAAGAVIRFAGLAFEPGLAMTLMLQSLHGLSFGAAHLGIMMTLTALAPAGGRGRAQGLFAAGMATAMAFGMITSGWLYQSLGPSIYFAMVPVAATGALCVLVAARYLKAQPQSSGVGG
jgi:MFS transporter, PPP family, 3-phenylpropionic acid transporter